MTKNFFTHVTILICLFATTNTFANIDVEFPAVYKTTNALNIRQYPYRASEKVGLIKKNTEIVVDSLHNARWACISYNNKIAYIATDFIVYQHKFSTNQETSLVDRSCASKIAKLNPFKGATKIVVTFILVVVAIIYLVCVGTECLIIYGFMILIVGVVYALLGPKWSFWATIVYLGFWFISALSNHETMLLIEYLLQPILALNKLQYYLQTPWRPLLKNRNSLLCRILKIAPEIEMSQHPFQRFCYRLWNVWHIFISFVFGILQCALYLICTPLRLVNAVFYNIIVHIPCALHDYIAEVFNPKGEGMRHLSK